MTSAHTTALAQLRIPPEMLAEAGVTSGTDAEVRDTLGLHGWSSCDLSGIVFRYRHPRTSDVVGHRVRLNTVPTGKGKYVNTPGLRHLYIPPARPEWLDDVTVPVVLVEAEKSALALLALGQRTRRKLLPIATGGCWGWKRNDGKRSTPDGGSEPVSAPSLTLSLLDWQGRQAIIAFDSNAADNPKVRAARRKLAEHLARCGASVSIATVPIIEGVNGPDDLLAVSGDEAAVAMLDTARPFAECALSEAEAAIAAVEADRKSDPLPAVEAIAVVDNDARRALLVGKLAVLKLAGLTKALIEDQVWKHRTVAAAEQKEAGEAARRGRLLCADVDGAELLGDLEQFFVERAHLPKGAAVSLALWAMFTWCQDAFATAPYICLESAAPGCGKSTVLDLLEAVCARAEQSAGLTKALLARTIEKTKATILLDQAEALRDRKDEAGVIAVLLSGYRRGKPYRCLVGDDHEPGEFSVFGPKAFCAVGGLEGALLDRCIVLHMEKKPEGMELESAEPEDLAPIAGLLRERIEAFALKAAPALDRIKATRPKGGHWPTFTNRERQLWTPLLSIARVCGLEAERRSVAAAELLSGRKAEAQADNPRAAKMVALAEVLAEFGAEKFSPKDLVSPLAETEAWGETLGEKLRKDDSSRAAANLVGHFLRDLRLESRERPHGKTRYLTAEALAKARQHAPQVPQKSAATAASAATPQLGQVFAAADRASSSAAGEPATAASGPSAADRIAGAAVDSRPSAAIETRVIIGSAADAAVAADKTSVQAPSQSGLFDAGWLEAEL